MSHLSLTDLSIILVEPSETQRKIIIKKLADENVLHVQAFAAVTDALQTINNTPPDLIVSSLYLKDGSALDILKPVKNNPNLADIPFMLISSENRTEKLEEFKQAGVAAILPKPFSTDNLSKALNASLDLINADELELNSFDIEQVRVLLVDDSRLARNHIRRVLKNLGIQQIIEAENGADALTYLKDHTFDLVFTDYNMPEMDGRELSEFIRFNPDTAHLPIIMVTSESTSSLHMANIHQTGISALCNKPFELKEVRKMIVTLLNN